MGAPFLSVAVTYVYTMCIKGIEARGWPRRFPKGDARRRETSALSKTIALSENSMISQQWTKNDNSNNREAESLDSEETAKMSLVRHVHRLFIVRHQAFIFLRFDDFLIAASVLPRREAGLLFEAADKGGNVEHTGLLTDQLNRIVGFRQQTAGLGATQRLNIIRNALSGEVLK